MEYVGSCWNWCIFDIFDLRFNVFDVSLTETSMMFLGVLPNIYLIFLFVIKNCLILRKFVLSLLTHLLTVQVPVEAA